MFLPFFFPLLFSPFIHPLSLCHDDISNKHRDKEQRAKMRIPRVVVTMALMGVMVRKVVGRALNGTHGGRHQCDQSFSLNVNHQCNDGDIFNWFACQNQANLSPECIGYIDSCFYDYCRGGGYITASASTSTSTSTSTTTSTTTVTNVALTSTTYDATFTTSV